MRITYVKQKTCKQSTQASQFKDQQTFFDEKSKYIFYSNEQIRKMEVNHEWELESIRESLKHQGPCEKIDLQRRTFSACVSNHLKKKPLIFQQKPLKIAIKPNNLKPSIKSKSAYAQKRNSIKINPNNLQNHKFNDNRKSIRSLSTKQQSTMKNRLKKKVFQMDDSSIILTENDLSLSSIQLSSENQESILDPTQESQTISQSSDSMQMIFRKIRISEYLKNEHNLLPQIESQLNKTIKE